METAQIYTDVVLKTENRAWWLNPYSLSTWGNEAGGFLSLRLVQGGARDYVMVQVSVTVVKYHDQKPLEEKGFISVSSLHPSSGGFRAGTWSRVLKLRPHRSTAYWLVPCGLLSLLPYMTRNSLPRGGITPVSWALPCQSLIKETPLQTCL